jgi:acetyltransferase-like isoleucine patch superfamily enzyme
MTTTLPWDWHEGSVPANVILEQGAYLETSHSFLLFRSRAPVGLRMRFGSSAYTGTMFDLGPGGALDVGRYVLLNSVRVICDAPLVIGDHTLIAWNVVLMDSYREPLDPERRRRYREDVAFSRSPTPGEAPRPIHIGPNVWIGFDSCVLPGVSVGEGSIVGARSVVAQSVPPYCLVAGNPARVIRRLERSERSHTNAHASK